MAAHVQMVRLILFSSVTTIGLQIDPATPLAQGINIGSGIKPGQFTHVQNGQVFVVEKQMTALWLRFLRETGQPGFVPDEAFLSYSPIANAVRLTEYFRDRV